jgi:hypothetical protein
MCCLRFGSTDEVFRNGRSQNKRKTNEKKGTRKLQFSFGDQDRKCEAKLPSIRATLIIQPADGYI